MLLKTVAQHLLALKGSPMRWKTLFVVLALFGLIGLVGSPQAQEKTDPAEKIESDSSAVGDVSATEASDEAFDRFVNPALLNRAVVQLDPELLTDVTLQLAEGQRVLGRPHRTVGIDKLLSLTIKTCVGARDQDNLKRLAGRFQAGGPSKLAEQVDLALALTKGARATGPDATLGFEKLPAEQHELVRLYRAQVATAQSLGDRSALQGLADGLQSFPGFTADQLAYLRKLATAAAADATQPDQDLAILQKLTSGSRGADAGTRVLNWCGARIGQGIMRGECAELPGAAFINVGAKKLFNESPSPGDYVWGTLIRTVSPNRNTTGDVRPGDVLQYHGVRYVNGNITTTADHHTSVVKAVSLGGSYLTVLEQNASNRRYVTQGVVNLKGLTAGVIYIYRPNDGTNIFPVTFTNNTRYTLSFRVGNTNATLAPGKTASYQIRNSRGSEQLGITWPATTSGGITVQGGEILFLEGQRTYAFTQNGSSFSVTKTGWIPSFYF
jgi:hypothetical protein